MSVHVRKAEHSDKTHLLGNQTDSHGNWKAVGERVLGYAQSFFSWLGGCCFDKSSVDREWGHASTLGQDEKPIGAVATAARDPLDDEDTIDQRALHKVMDEASDMLNEFDDAVFGARVKDVPGLEAFAVAHSETAMTVFTSNFAGETVLISEVSQVAESVIPAINQALEQGKNVVFIPVKIDGKLKLMTLTLGQTDEGKLVHISSPELQKFSDELSRLSSKIQWPKTPLDTLISEVEYHHVLPQTLDKIDEAYDESSVVCTTAHALREQYQVQRQVQHLHKALQGRSDYLLLKVAFQHVRPSSLPEGLRGKAEFYKEMSEDDFNRDRVGTGRQLKMFYSEVNDELERIDLEIEELKPQLEHARTASRSFTPVTSFLSSRVGELQQELASILR
ncbi:hypothetical protein [Simkania sp.]|uniref:hypothetical protein n=1 Tax=Simkania sp. TaxID=34094 RepID=UPI003B51CDE8